LWAVLGDIFEEWRKVGVFWVSLGVYLLYKYIIVGSVGFVKGVGKKFFCWENGLEMGFVGDWLVDWSWWF